MARVLNGTSQYLSRTNPISAFPFTVAGWLRRANTTADSVGWVMYQTGANDYLYGGLLGAVAGDPFRTDAYNASGSGTAATSTGYSANTWTHCASVMTSASSFASLINGGSKGTQTGTWAGNIASLGNFTFGYLNAFSLNIYGQNDVAEFGIWSVALTDSEIASLAKGFSPLEIRPASLVAYYPLGGHYGQSDVDRWKNRHDLTAYNSPTWSDHPRVIYPGPSFAPIKATVASSTKYWAFARQRSRIIGGGLGT